MRKWHGICKILSNNINKCSKNEFGNRGVDALGLADLISDLYSSEEKTRAFAAEDIAYDGLVEGIGPLLERLQEEPSRFVREVIINSLKTMQGPELIVQVIPFLNSDDAFIRNGCIDILAGQGEDAIGALRSSLSSPDKDIRKFTLDTLFKIGTESAAELIADSLNDADVNNLITAVEYLGRLDSRDYVGPINQLFLDTPNVLLRCTCLETMALIGNDESLLAVNKMYPDDQSISFLEKYSFLKFVAKMGTMIHLALIISLLEAKNSLMHKEMINAIEGILQRSKLERLPAELLAALDHYLDSPLREINKYEILLLISDYKNQEIPTILTRYLDPQNRLLCMGAIEGLGNYGSAEISSDLIKLKEGLKDEEIMESIERSLTKLT